MKNYHKYADLQIHSVYSDGTYRPEELLDKAASTGLRAISLTDHNYLLPIDVIKKITSMETKLNIKFIEGVEISSTFNNIDFHLLVYSKKIKRTNKLLKILSTIHNGYANRGNKIIAKINSDGYKLEKKEFDNYFYTYLHKNLIASVCNKKYNLPLDYVKKMKMLEDIQMASFENLSIILKKANCISILAHPGDIYKKTTPEFFENFLIELIEHGLDGFELFHFKNSDKKMIEILKKLAIKYNLIITGGSDYHSDTDSVAQIGEYGLTFEQFKLFYKRLP